MDYRSLLRQQADNLDQDPSEEDTDDQHQDDARAGANAYQPPTEAQLKVLKARRERSDRIAKRMGECLLRGWRMLDSVCPDCGTILMQPTARSHDSGDGSEDLYCISCRELESDVSKDDPAQSAVAARAQAREAQVRESSRAKPVDVPVPAAPPPPQELIRQCDNSTAAIQGKLRSSTLNRLEFYRLLLEESTRPEDTERILNVLERLLTFIKRLPADVDNFNSI